MRAAGACVLAAGLAGCSRLPSVLDPQGPEARSLKRLFDVFMIVSGVVWVAVMLALVVVVVKRHPGVRSDPLLVDPTRERRGHRLVGALAVATGLTVLGLTGVSYAVQRALHAEESGIVIRVTGHQWWWELRYDSETPSRQFTTANEIHVPVGEPVVLELRASDVIHSFWVPAVMGKKDLIPGQANRMRLTVERPGVYRGQCAEFCGLQHAHMGLLLVAEPRADYDKWVEKQIAPADEPVTEEAKRGRDVFQGKACVMCHGIRGTDAGGRTGPDLTHLGGRQTLAAGTLPTSRGTIAAWIADPQGIKPGNQMPLVKLSADELNAVAAYLEGLQ
ncbi:cytochrome c oxidase subunit II [Prosthecomicrobium sp. N25]|uniref:cytochrome c oxidase subunit II n=1 Tax=Prosthecomicrobium sp. N25 TaxID=3129254 RepID=UPI0030786A70